MPNSNKQKALNALRKMKLTEDDRDPEKDPYESNSDLASRLDVGSATVNLARKNLIFALEYGINIDKSIVYAWRYCNDKRYAKISKCKKGGILRERMKTTFHPIDDIFLIGIKEYRYEKEARLMEKHILDTLGQTRCGREWVFINEDFNELINEKFTKIERIVE